MLLMSDELKNWKARPRPERKVMQGLYVRLEPLDLLKHGDGLYAASATPDASERFAWLYEYPPEDRNSFLDWVARVEKSEDPLFFAVTDNVSGEVAGRQALMRIDNANGVIEVGSIYWGPSISRKPAATEALYLFGKYVFDELGYRRLEWKCNDKNEPSKRAALRFGFKAEGLFRQHLVVKGANRDTAWFSMIDSEWPAVRDAFECWLDPDNFDANGRQRRKLQDWRGTS